MGVWWSGVGLCQYADGSMLHGGDSVLTRSGSMPTWRWVYAGTVVVLCWLCGWSMSARRRVYAGKVMVLCWHDLRSELVRPLRICLAFKVFDLRWHSWNGGRSKMP